MDASWVQKLWQMPLSDATVRECHAAARGRSTTPVGAYGLSKPVKQPTFDSVWFRDSSE